MQKKIFLILLLMSNIIIAQEDKTVTLNVSGTGKTLEEAKTNALRSAIEQAFGAFISSKTELLNDNLISDQITSVANGNIQSFDILDKFQLLDNNWSATLKAVVSVNKLISFVESKGITVEIKGGLFALNVKQQMLNEENEIRSILDLAGVLFDYMQNSFDYNLEVGEPKSVNGDNQKWNLPIYVTATSNKNMDALNDYCINTLKNISLSEEEIKNYTSLNKSTFKLTFMNNLGENIFYFRKEISVDILEALFDKESILIENFIIDTGKEKLSEYDEIKSNVDYLSQHKINLFSKGIVLGTFQFNYVTNLAGIESMSNISVSTNKNRYEFKVPKKENYNSIIYNDLENLFVDSLEKPFDDIETYSSDNNIYNTAGIEVKPHFPSGLEKFYKFISKNFKVPNEEGLVGKIFVTFVVEKNGSLSDIKVIRDMGYGTGKEAIRVLKRSPKWNAGEMNGKKVRVLYSLPISVN
jgi:hypothetical protein